MSNIKPDTAVFELNRSQPEFKEQVWQYLNRRVSDWRIITGKEKAKEYAPLFARIEKDYGVEPSVMLGLWGIESAFGDPDVQKNHMRPVIPALAALAWGEPRRRAYWEQELLNALVIIDRGWSTPEEMRGSWAGAMGHTQWMPEVWLNVGLDYDRDGRVSPFGKPEDALAGTAQYLVKRGKYRAGEHWGYEVRGVTGATREGSSRSYDAWQKAGVSRADLPARPEFLCRALLQPFDELHAVDRASRRPHHGSGSVRPALPRGRTHAHAGRSAGDPEAPDHARLRYRWNRRTGRQRHHDRGAQFPAQSRHAAR
jgi:lytic murein transglycosylase